MNEFTKEELRYLDHCLEQFKFSCMNEEFENKTSVLRLKIQSMVDNYEAWSIPKCGKCGKVLNDY